MSDEDDAFVDPAESGPVRKGEGELEAKLAGMNDRQKSIALAEILRETCSECEHVMSPAAVLSALLAAYVEYGRERFPARVLSLHLRREVERLECPPH